MSGESAATGPWRRARPWLWLAAAGGAAMLALPLLPLPEPLQVAIDELLLLVACFVAAVLCYSASLAATGRQVTGWRLLGAAAGVFAAAQAAWTWMVTVQGQAAFPSIADLGFLAFYPLALAGLLVLSPLSDRQGLVRAALVIDGLLAALGLYLLAWPVVLDDAFDALDDRAAALLSVTYPVLDLLLLGLAGGMLMRHRQAWRSRLGLAYAGLLGLLAADLNRATQVFAGSFATAQLADAGWVIGFLLLGAAARAPAPAEDTRQRYAGAIGRILPLAAVGAVIVAFILVRSLQAERDPVWAGAAATVLMAALLRQLVNEREHARLARDAQSAEARYRDILESATVGILRTAPDGRVLFANDAFARIFGYGTGDALMAANVSSSAFYAKPEQRQDMLALLQASGQVEDFPIEFKRRDGTLGWVRGSMRMVRDPKGDLLYLEAFLNEVTKEHRLANDLRRAQRTLRVISLCDHALVHAKDEASLTKQVCDLLIEHGGYRFTWIGMADVAIGRPVRPVASAGYDAGYLSRLQASWDETDPRGQGPVGRAIRELRTQVAQELQRGPNLEAWHAEAISRGYAASCALPLELPGERGALVVFAGEPHAFGADEVTLLEELAADLTFGIKTLRERALKGQAERERDAAYARYSSIVNNASEGILRTRPDGAMVFANQAAASILGYASAAQFLDEVQQVLAIYADPTQRPALLEHFKLGDRAPVEIELMRRDGSRFWAAVRGTFVNEPDGSVQVQSVIEDLTERRRVEEERRQAETARSKLAEQDREVQRLQELNKLRLDFLNTAAHDLKTPLTPLKLQMAILRMQGTTPKQRDGLALMERNVNRFEALIEDMLDAARLQSGRLRLKREPIDLGLMVQEAVASFQESARQAGLQVEVSTAPGVLVDADQTKLMQVLMNLVSNAIKYTPKGGRIRVRAAGGGADGTEATIQVEDTGLGLTPEQMMHMFQPFVRLHEAVPGSAKGTGLGLYISKGIVEQHGGRLLVESEGSGRGSTFTAVWPMAALHPPVPAHDGQGEARADGMP